MNRAGIIGVWVGLGLVATGCGGPLNSDELRREIESLGNDAAIASALAKGVVDRRIETTFVRVSARDLADTTDHEAETLADATGREPARQQAVTLAKDLSGLIRQLQVHPDDPAAARRLLAEFQDMNARASNLAESP
jgi:hypothetical protein